MEPRLYLPVLSRGTAAPTFRPTSIVAQRSPISANAELLSWLHQQLFGINCLTWLVLLIRLILLNLTSRQNRVVSQSWQHLGPFSHPQRRIFSAILALSKSHPSSRGALFLVWSWTLTYGFDHELDLNRVKVNQYANIFCLGHFVHKLSRDTKDRLLDPDH